MLKHITAALIVLALTGCSSPSITGLTQPTPTREASEVSAPEETPTPAETLEPDPRADVPWEDYAPVVQESIDQMTVAADCAGLQDQFDTADGNNVATMNRTGHNNAKLMSYIDESMRLAGCY